MGLTSCSCFRLQKYCGIFKWYFTPSFSLLLLSFALYCFVMNGFNDVANNLTIAALVFLGAKVGEHSEMIFHWLIFPVFCCLGCI